MSAREFSIKLNLLAKYTSSIASLERGKLDMFMKSKTISQHMTKDRKSLV